jgi:hypothetical protein
MDSFKRFLKSKKAIVFLDFEGTQFSHEIIAIGAIKVMLDENKNIIDSKDAKTFKIYVKPLGIIGKIVEEMTSINEDLLIKQGVTLEEAFKKFQSFVNMPSNDVLFITFGNNDAKMIIDSINLSKPNNFMYCYSIVNNIFDYLPFISKYIKDNNNNNYSLVNYIKLFNVEPNGVSHDPLNDAIDLKNLYKAMDERKDIVLDEYLKVIEHTSSYPTPIKALVTKLYNGETVTKDDLIEECKKQII